MLLCRICIPTNASEATTPAAATLWLIVLLDIGNRDRGDFIGLTRTSSVAADDSELCREFERQIFHLEIICREGDGRSAWLDGYRESSGSATGTLSRPGTKLNWP